jgi:hypothetical protein
LKKQFPVVWQRVEDAVRDDVRQCLVKQMGRIRVAPTDSDISRIAHNAAFSAVLEVRDATRPPTGPGKSDLRRTTKLSRPLRKSRKAATSA